MNLFLVRGDSSGVRVKACGVWRVWRVCVCDVAAPAGLGSDTVCDMIWFDVLLYYTILYHIYILLYYYTIFYYSATYYIMIYYTILQSCEP